MTRQRPESDKRPSVSNDDGETKILVASGPFARFSAWLDDELAKLEARWAHCAAPNAGTSRRKIKEVQANDA